jgi:hypothetical protein
MTQTLKALYLCTERKKWKLYNTPCYTGSCICIADMYMACESAIRVMSEGNLQTRLSIVAMLHCYHN